MLLCFCMLHCFPNQVRIHTVRFLHLESTIMVKQKTIVTKGNIRDGQANSDKSGKTPAEKPVAKPPTEDKGRKDPKK